MYEKLKGKIALVTGASTGIGKVIALELARNGVKIALNYIGPEENAKEVIEQIKKFGSDGIAIKADISNFEEAASMVNAIKEKFGVLDILVNNAGITKDRTLKNMSQEEWTSVINVNLTGAFNVTKNALGIMNDNGRIISISSIVAFSGNFGQTNYSASKAGIVGFTKSLAKELGKRKITVNAIAPGFIKTQMTKKIPFLRKKIIQSLIPLGEIGLPEDVANTVLFLASEKSRYITGEVICVTGGLSF